MSRILIVVARHPWPPRRGDQIRGLQTAEILAREHEVTLLAPAAARAEARKGVEPRARDAGFELVEYLPASHGEAASGLLRSFARGAPLQAGLYRSASLDSALERLAPRHDLVVLQLVRLAPSLDRLAGRPVVIDLIDSLALSTARRASLDRLALRPALHWESARLARWERSLVRRTAGAMVVSERDRAAIARGLGGREEDRLRVVPVAVSGRGAEAEGPEGAAGGPPTLILTGNLGYFPTREGLRWFLESVWPRLGAERPDLRLEVAGSRPSRSLRRALRRAGAHLVESPPDLASRLARATVALAPMRAGAGQPMKVVEAWAAGVPVVATSWTAEGTTGVAGEDLLVADDPEAWCRAVIGLVDDPALRQRIARAAHRRLRRDYSSAEVGERLHAVVSEALAADGEDDGRA